MSKTRDKYDNPTYRATRKKLAPIIARNGATCTQPICLMPTRTIQPGEPWDLGHNNNGAIIGPTHTLCNRTDGGKKRHTPQPNRWTL